MTPRVEITEARIWHCGQIARAVRAAHIEGLVALGYNGHRELRQSFEASCVRKSCFVDGKLAAMWGLNATLAEPQAYVWLAVNDVAMRYPYRIARTALREIDGFFLFKSRLVTAIVVSDSASATFAARLGFEEIERTDDLLIVEKRRPVSTFAEVHSQWPQ